MDLPDGRWGERLAILITACPELRVEAVERWAGSSRASGALPSLGETSLLLALSSRFGNPVAARAGRPGPRP